MSLLDWRKQSYACDKCASIYSECHAKNRFKCKYHAPNYDKDRIANLSLPNGIDGDIIPIERWLKFYRSAVPSEIAIAKASASNANDYDDIFASETRKISLLVPELLGLGEKNGEFLRGDDDFGGNDDAKFCADWTCDLFAKLCNERFIPKQSVNFRFDASKERSFTNLEGCTLNSATLDLFAHEFAHYIEANNRDILERNTEYLDERCGDEKPTVIESSDDGEDLVGRRDRFFRPHTGVDYIFNGVIDGKYVKCRVMTEVLAQGIQDIVYDPVEFYLRDKGHFIHTLETLKGEW